MSKDSVPRREVPLESFVEALLGAFRSGSFDDPSSLSIDTLTLDQAYAVQSRIVERRIGQGESAVGYKVGCTSRAIREQFGLQEPVIGRLMSPHVHEGDTALSWSDYVNCAVEAELVFRIGREVPADFPSAELRTAIESVSAGIEVHNYKFWYGRPTIQELVASNAIHACLVVGKERTGPEKLDFEMEGVGLFVDGALAASGISAETMGSPLRSLQWLAKRLQDRGEMLRAGDLVIPGSPVRLVSVERGNVVTGRFSSCGAVRAEFV